MEEQYRERTGFLIMPKRPYEWRVDSHGCYKFDNAALGFGLREQSAYLPVFLHLRTTNLPGPDSIMRSEQAHQRRMERRHHKHDRTGRRRTRSRPCPSRSCECVSFHAFCGCQCVIRWSAVFTHRIDAWTLCFKSLGQHCSHFCANTHRSLLLHLSLVLAFVCLCSQMEGQQNVQLPPGTTELNRSYYTANSFSAPQSSQQFHDDPVSTSVHPLVSTQEINDTTPSCSALGPQLLHGHIGSPVLAGPTRNVTGEAMPTSLAEAITQLSFLEFLQRCGVSIAPLQPTQPLVPISLLDVAVQTASPCEVSQDASTQTSDQPVSSLSLDVAVQTIFHSVRTSSLDAAVQTLPHSTLAQDVSTRLFRLLYAVMCYTMLPHNYRSRSSLLDVSTRTIPWTAKTSFVSPRHQYKVHVPCCSRRQDSNSQPRLLILLLTLTCLPHMVRLPSAFPVMPCSRLSVPPMWEHTLYAQLLAPKEVLVPPLREPTILLVLILVQEQVLFLNHRHWFFPWSNLGNPSLTGLVTLTQPTAISCIINSAFPFFSGIQARRAEILPTLSPLPVESFMRLFKKPVIMFRTSPISSWRTPATRTSPSCSTRTPSSPTLRRLPSGKTPQAKVRGLWSYSSFEAS